MTYDDWKTTDPADLRDDRDDDRDDRDDVPEYLDETPSPADASVEPHAERCTGCAGTGWVGGVLLSRICDWGCAGAGTRLVWR